MAAVVADAGNRKATKRRKLATVDAGDDEAPAAPVAVDETDDGARKDKKRAKTGAAAPSAEDRLAALGEAFMRSIDGPPPKRAGAAVAPRQSANVASSEPRKVGAPGLPGEGKKRRRNKNKNKARAAGSSAIESAPAKGGSGSNFTAPHPNNSAGLQAAVARASAAVFGGASLAAPAAAGAPPQMSKRERRDFMSGKVSCIRSSWKPENDDAPEQRRGGTKPGARSEQDAEFQKTLKEVLHFVTPQLGKRERQQYEDSKIRALGGTIEKQKMPYKRFQETIKQNKEKREKLVAEDKYMGVEMSANAYKASWVVDSVLKKKKAALKDKKERQEGGINRLGMGARERNGMATISRAAINGMKRGGKK